MKVLRILAACCALAVAVVPLTAQAAFYMNLREKPSKVKFVPDNVRCSHYPTNIYCQDPTLTKRAGGIVELWFPNGTYCRVDITYSDFDWHLLINGNSGPKQCSYHFRNSNTADLFFK
jgi:hypothetical protein